MRKASSKPAPEYKPTFPDDPDLLAAIAKVAIGHGYHDLELKMALKSVMKLTPEQARRRYRTTGSHCLRELLKQAAIDRGIGTGAQRRLEAFLKRSAEATRKRNKFVHAFWCLYKGKKRIVHIDADGTPWPSARSLDNLGTKLTGLADEMEYERRHGWLKKALDKVPQESGGI